MIWCTLLRIFCDLLQAASAQNPVGTGYSLITKMYDQYCKWEEQCAQTCINQNKSVDDQSRGHKKMH